MLGNMNSIEMDSENQTFGLMQYLSPHAKYFCIVLIFKKRKSYINVQAQYKLVQVKTNLELDKNLACFTKSQKPVTNGQQTPNLGRIVFKRI